MEFFPQVIGFKETTPNDVQLFIIGSLGDFVGANLAISILYANHVLKYKYFELQINFDDHLFTLSEKTHYRNVLLIFIAI